jgi:hypothetical protein
LVCFYFLKRIFISSNNFCLAVLATPAINNLILLSTVFFFQGISQGMADLGLFFLIEKEFILIIIYFKVEQV